MDCKASDPTRLPAVSVTQGDSEEGARERRLILVVDRDSRRGLDLAIAVLASPGWAPASMGRGAPPTTEPAVGVTVITRDVHLTCNFDSLSAGMTCRLVSLADGESESDQYGRLEHTGTVADPRGALILDNPPADQSQEVRTRALRKKNFVHAT